MWPLEVISRPLPSKMVLADTRDELVIVPHHPDRLRRPGVRPAAHARERAQQALVWNVFRTLELVTPAVWMRSFQARLFRQPVTPAPQIAKVALWQPLVLPPACRLDGGRTDAFADVTIETEHAVWTLLVSSNHDWDDSDDPLCRLIEAGAWLAGTRHHYCGVIDVSPRQPSVGELLRARFARSRDSVSLRTSTGVTAPGSDPGIGVTTWPDLAAVLTDCAHSEHLPSIERALATHAVSWLRRVGIEPSN
jgi:hypothetical protein